MRNRTIILLLLLVSGCAVAQAQRPSPSHLKKARVKAYEWVRNYNGTREGNFSGRRARRDFSKNFSDTQDTVFHDYLPATAYPFQHPYTTVEEYCNIRMDSALRYKTEYKPSQYAVGAERQNGNIITLEVSWKEDISYLPTLRIDKTLRYPDFTFYLAATLDYDCTSGEIIAKAIRLDQPPIQPFVIFHSGEENIVTTLADIQQKVERDNRMIVKALEQQHPEDEKFYITRYDTMTNRFGVEGSYGKGLLILDYRHDTRHSATYASASAFSIGINYYHQMSYRGKSRWGFELMPLFRSLDYNYGFDYTDQSSDTDPDGGPYERRVSITGYHERLLTSSVSLPINLRYDYMIPSINASFFGRLGVAPAYAFTRVATASADQFHVSGYYDWLYNVELDFNGIYDFGTTADKTFSAVQTDIPAIMLEGVGGLGVAYWPTLGFSVELSVNYTPLLFQQTNTSTDYHISPSTDSWVAAANDITAFQHHLLNFMLQLSYHF